MYFVFVSLLSKLIVRYLKDHLSLSNKIHSLYKDGTLFTYTKKEAQFVCVIMTLPGSITHNICLNPMCICTHREFFFLRCVPLLFSSKNF